MTLDNAIFTAVISAFVITLPAVFAFINQRRKDKRDARNEANQAVADVIVTLRSQMKQLKSDLDEEHKDRKCIEDEREQTEIEKEKVIEELKRQTQKNTEAMSTIFTLRNQLSTMAAIQLKNDEEAKQALIIRETASVENQKSIEVLQMQIAELAKSPSAVKIRALEARIAALGKELEDCFGKISEGDVNDPGKTS